MQNKPRRITAGACGRARYARPSTGTGETVTRLLREQEAPRSTRGSWTVTEAEADDAPACGAGMTGFESRPSHQRIQTTAGEEVA